MKDSKLDIAENQMDNGDSTLLIERVEIENTPFTAVKKGDEWFVCWGEYGISGPHKDEESCREALDVEPYKIMTVMIVAVMDKKEQITRFEKERPVYTEEYAKKAKEG